MRNQHVERVTRVAVAGIPSVATQAAMTASSSGLFVLNPQRSSRLQALARRFAPVASLLSLLLAAQACQEPLPDAPKDASADAALGVDAEFGVETFALSAPTLTIVKPTLTDYYLLTAGVNNTIPGTPCVTNICQGTGLSCNQNSDCSPYVQVNLTNATFGTGSGALHFGCKVQGGAFTFSSIDPDYQVPGHQDMVQIPSIGTSQGSYEIECFVADETDVPLPIASAWARRSVSILYDSLNPASPKCASDQDCDDGNGCSIELCKGGKCTYAAVQNCCVADASCTPGESCLNPKLTTSKCSVCTQNIDCDDGIACNTDVCDLSGTKGVCKHVQAPDVCCNVTDKCDDGKPCTIDACNVALGKCTHTVPNGGCCEDAECTTGDSCKVGACIQFQCRFAPDNNKDDCCSAQTNSLCDDKDVCTIDACSVNKGGWTQCSHVADPNNPLCCNDPSVCSDGDGCTTDKCVNHQCAFVPVAECCITPNDCVDPNACTVDTCSKKSGETAGECVHTKTPECCTNALTQVKDCDDGKFCTADSCNTLTSTCVHTPPPAGTNCCDTDSECNDGKLCTADVCLNHYCLSAPDINNPDCCESPTDKCADGDPCNIDSCDMATKKCIHVPGTDQTCCKDSTACDDGNCQTIDVCTTNNQCVNKFNPASCSASADCDDGSACTIDTCDTSSGCGVCTHVAAGNGCCTANNALSTCNDQNPCTTDACDLGTNTCTHNAIDGCCTSDADAAVKCDDNDSCTVDYCQSNLCRHTVPKNGCCVSNADCNDGNKCTADICDTGPGLVNGHYLCKFEKQDPNCIDCEISSAIAGVDCNDNNPCTADSCDQVGHCHNNAIQECCVDKFDCDDSNGCTFDYCSGIGKCVHTETQSGVLLCCKQESQDQDCAYLNNECSKGVCMDAGKGNGETKCVAQAQDVCTVNIGYCQPFQSSTNLHEMGWNPGFSDGTDGTTNWKAVTTGSLGPDQHVSFSWTPTKINYMTCLQSPVIQAAGSKNITLQYDHEFLWNSNATTYQVLGSLDGANADWNQATVISTGTLVNDIGAQTVDVALPPVLTGSNGLRLAFCLSGESTFDLKSFSLDNVCIAKGQKPALTACPVNQVVPFNTKKKIPLKARDPDAGDILTFQLLEAPSFVTLDAAIYFWVDKSWNTSLNINPTNLNQVGTHNIKLKVSDGILYSTCSFQVTVSYQGGFLVITPPSDNGLSFNVNGGDEWKTTLEQLAPSKVVQHINNMSLYPNLTQFEAVFLVLGVYPDNHTLTDGEAAVFQSYLTNGGRLYMEGGDTWVYDHQTPLHPYFKVTGVADSVSENIAPQLLGSSIYKDLLTQVNGAPKVYSFGFDQSDLYNDNIDEIAAKTDVHRTQNMLQADGFNDRPFVQVGHQDDAGYRTIASSIPYAGVRPGPVSGDPASDMAKRILNFFANGFVDCVADADCNDDDVCTADSCQAGECINASTCTCNPMQALTCDSAPITVVSNDAGATSSVKAYSCDGSKLYTGKEKSYSFSTTSSRPVTITVSNLTNPDAQVFIIRGDGTGTCLPGQCLVGMGNGTKTFAGAKNGEYFIVLDSPTTGAQADIAISCGQSEVCDDGIDNNGNGLLDCSDIESCCGDAACAEICDGVDNNCDGKIDEGCDKDGDGYCDAKQTVIGNPPVCPGGGTDCNDNNGTVNPGQAEQCGNLRDDNCNGVTDEEGGASCTNYWVDADGDNWGGANPKCLCAPTAVYKAIKGGDCDDTPVTGKKVNPGLIEICGNGVDDDCSGSQNDANAQGCTVFYQDLDGDGTGTLSNHACYCQAFGNFAATTAGDCNDSDKFVYPTATEVCNNVDDNCNNQLDEGCDDDHDGYCDANLGYVSIGVTSKQCGTGAEGTLVALNCEAGRTITGIDFASFGNPTGICGNYHTGTCSSPATLQAVKTACLGKNSCSINVATALLGDGCAGQTKNFDVQVTCMGSGGTPPGVCTSGPGDSDDTDPSINPAGQEICDNIDNNSDGLVDEGCDDDADGFCDSAMIVIGAPLVCPAGAGDCDDTPGTGASINPGVTEDCATTADDDCDGTLNNQDALNCTVFFSDGDSDGYGTKSFKCFCSAVASFKATKTADCQDSNPAINPGVIEACNGIDDDCDGVTDNGCDVDGDGFCATGLVITSGTTACPNGGGDCDDTIATGFNVNPGQLEVCGDGIDNNCNGSQNDAGALLCTTYYADLDNDGYGGPNTSCRCAPVGNFKVTVSGDCNDNVAAINPSAAEICDNIDNNCSGGVAGTDEGCDDDQDGYCDASIQLVGTVTICGFGGGDCNDGDSTIHPNLAQEVCDNKDDDCNGVIDNGCDKDKDGYCDASYAVISPTPPVCYAGSNDCDDYDNTVHPNALEICGNTKDDNCNGSQNDQDAQNCKLYYFDADNDAYGLNSSRCLCAAAGSYKALQGNDCDDSKSAVNPGQTELCSTAFDDNCDGDTNDENATGCTARALDADGDGYGLLGLTKCYCVAANSYGASTSNAADCNDSAAAVNPGATEKCNDIDDNCKTGVDEGCDDDGDKFCDGAMVTVGAPNVCSSGGGDCDDTKSQVNPGKAEICDNLDNNCSGVTDENCNKDGDAYCDANMVTTVSSKCAGGGGDCDDTKSNVNPGATETCSTAYDDNCNGITNEVNASGCTNYGVDIDGDTYSDKNKATVCYCAPNGTYTGTSAGDCDDLNNLVHPGLTEICDGKDNNCNGVVDEGCDDDHDGWCDSAMTTVGKPAVTCINGGGDCNDLSANINPGKAELCSTAGVDDNCSGGFNDINATGCTTFYLDNDADTYGVNVPQCTCVTTGKYTVTSVASLGDCDDTNANVNPGRVEVCGDNLDNNCNGTQNDTGASGCVTYYADADLDGYGPNSGGSNCQCFAQGTYVASLTGDCNDNNAALNPGKTEICDNLDNNCSGGASGTDEGCDDDNDNYCDAAMVIVGTPSTCTAGGGDCNDVNNAVGIATFPGQTEKCDNIDQNCNSVTDEGCDDDKDGYCDKTMTVIYTPQPTVCASTTSAATLDCDDTAATVNPLRVEICDGLDNNCNGTTDENCDKDADGYCDSAMQTVGKPAACVNGGGDCNDSLATVNPGRTEICNNVDDNCVGGVDEVCKDTDGDGYCVGVVSVASAVCPNGGSDCDDSRATVHPGQNEDCSTQYDDNCDGNTNPTTALTGGTKFYTDADGDGYGTGTGQTSCYQVGTFTALVNTDCNDTKAAINPSAQELCDGLDNNCKSGTDEGCDDDADGYCDKAMLITSTATCANTLPKPAVGATAPGDDCVDSGVQGLLSGTVIHPGATEDCEAVDNDCNGITDDNCDKDKDGYCDSAKTVTFGSPSTCVNSPIGAGNDCNDNNALVNPGKAENCKTAYDDDCNGSLNAANADGCTLFYLDADNDSYGVTASTACQCVASTSAPFYRATQGGDCNDASATIYPGATEICDNKDNNCDAFAKVDEGCDVDKDGYCAAGMTVTLNTACPNTASGGTGNDCNDTDKTINPGAIEVCDNQDNNCVSGTDENCNKDGDGYCDATKTTVGTPTVCPSGGGDCNDTAVTGTAINPGAAEVCDSKDNNCNGLTDDNPTNGTVFYYDGDQDGEPLASNQVLCAASGFWTWSKAAHGNAVPATFDCSDDYTTGSKCGANCSHALSENRCDGADNNCNGTVDENCNVDADGYCTSALPTIKDALGNWPTVCTLGGGDCDDTATTGPGFNPGKTEACDNKDNNCNGQTDEAASAQCQIFPNAIGLCTAGACVQTACQTGYADSNVSVAGCECYTRDQYEGTTGNETCAAATDLGNLQDGSANSQNAGQVSTIQAMVYDTTDHDWFRFRAVDTADTADGSCDHYAVRAQFTTVVANVVFDIYRGTQCPNVDNVTGRATAFTRTTSTNTGPGNGTVFEQPPVGTALSSIPTGWNQVCCGQQDFNWYVEYKDWSTARQQGNSYSEYGECPCAANDIYTSSSAGNSLGWAGIGNSYYYNGSSQISPAMANEWGPYGKRNSPWGNGTFTADTANVHGVFPTGYDYTKCLDDSAFYYVHVYRTSGAACSNYRLEVSNGVYHATQANQAAGQIGGWSYNIGNSDLGIGTVVR